jgi:preprotein translocase SecE subunit
MAAVTRSNQRDSRNDGTKAMPQEEPLREGEGDEESEQKPKAERNKGNQPAPAAKKPSQGFFTIYKKGQGYWTRMGTAIGAAFLGVMISFEIYHQVPTFLHGGDQKTDIRIGLISALVFLALYSLVAFWFTNKPSNVDFLVATDSEMKMVNWTSRKELIGSTRIVIMFMFLVTFYLFFCDQIFQGLFRLIRVLKF